MRSAIRAHVNTLGAKAYWAQFDDAARLCRDVHSRRAFPDRRARAGPDPVGLCVRQEGAAGDADQPDRHRPDGRSGWRQERLAKEARQIGELGKELYERLAKAADDLRKVGSGLSTAVNNYNSLSPALRRRSLVTARKFRELNIEPGRRDIDVLTPVEALPRYADDELELRKR